VQRKATSRDVAARADAVDKTAPFRRLSKRANPNAHGPGLLRFRDQKNLRRFIF
jgi:hypothetical protein